MRITILTYLETEDSKTYDVVVDQVAAALTRGGHQTSVLGSARRPAQAAHRTRPAASRAGVQPDGDVRQEPGGGCHGGGCAQLARTALHRRRTGELFLQADKALAKKLLAFDGIAYPNFAVFDRQSGDLETGGNLRMPIFVKPLDSDASIGIDQGSLVHSTMALMERVLLIHRKHHASALAEEYIEGREFYVGVLGNHEPQALPPIEMDFSGMPTGMARVLDSKAKWSKRSAEYKGSKAVMADVSEEVRARLQRVAIQAYRALRVRDYGRVDLRMQNTGEVYVIEVNANCYLEQSGEFVMAAQAAELPYDTLINRIATLAAERNGVTRRKAA